MVKETNFPHPPQGHVALLAWDDVNKRWQAIYVDAAGFIQVELAPKVVDVEATQLVPSDLRVAQHQYDGAAWRKSNLLWGYYDTYSEFEQETADEAETITLTFSTVPEGEVWYVTSFTANVTTTNPSFIALYGVLGGLHVTTRVRLYGTAIETVETPTPLVLAKDDYLYAQFVACQNGDLCKAWASGYKMKIDM